MVVFKINGERNSGTTFLSKVLRLNGFPIYVRYENNVIYHWKHSIPTPDIKEVDDLVVDIVIFRNLEDWLVSMYKNPYHMKRMLDFESFITLKQTSNDYFHVDQTNNPINQDDTGKTIFEIRYYKFQKIMEYAKQNKNVFFVNLSFLQQESNLAKFLHHLNTTYLKHSRTNYITKIPHTKNGKDIVNREYDINVSLYRSIIDQFKNIEIEHFIEQLKISSNRVYFEKKRFSILSLK
jgi:hypothetical protein